MLRQLYQTRRCICNVKTYTAIVSGHIYLDDDGEKDIEILTNINNDTLGTDIFCDIDIAIVRQIDIGRSHDYYFIAKIESNFVELRSWESVEYDVEHDVTEIKMVDQLIK